MRCAACRRVNLSDCKLMCNRVYGVVVGFVSVDTRVHSLWGAVVGVGGCNAGVDKGLSLPATAYRKTYSSQ